MMSGAAYPVLKQLIEAVHPLGEEDLILFSSIWTPYSARRKTVVTRPGEVERYLYLVLEGVQRVYYLDDQDREATLIFTYAPSFGGVLDSFMLQQPSRYTYETLTASRLLRTPYGEVQKLMDSRPGISAVIRHGTNHALSGVLERLVELQCYSSEEKFKKLLQRSRHLLQLVPHKYIANYLGIDATNFSKLINRVRV